MAVLTDKWLVCGRGGLPKDDRASYIGPLDMVPIGPATRCDAVHSRWDVPNLLRYIKIACDVLRCIFQHVVNFGPDFGIYSNCPILKFLSEIFIFTIAAMSIAGEC